MNINEIRNQFPVLDQQVYGKPLVYLDNAMLHEHIDDMIKRRLRGELSSCENCVLRCSHPKDYNFDIDYSKI